jgi:predicted nucleic acid-binding protein
LSSRNIIVADTSVLLNFIRIDQLSLIEKDTRHWIITEHVWDEITSRYEQHAMMLEASIQKGAITQASLTSMAELKRFAQLTSINKLGLGECAAIAYAIIHKCPVAIDDKAAIKAAQQISPNISVIRTQDIVVSLIQQSLLTRDQADAIKKEWEDKHRFRLKFESFSEIS